MINFLCTHFLAACRFPDVSKIDAVFLLDEIHIKTPVSCLVPKLSDLLSGLKSGTLFQIKFKDRVGAGVALATALKFTVKRNKGSKPPLVLGIPRGGIIVADIIAKKMNADFDVIISRKLTSPDNKESAIGAVMSDGSIYLDEFLVHSLKVPPEYIEREKQEQLKEIERRTALYRPNSKEYEINGKTVILVDDGIATGATVIAAARWIKRQQPNKLVIAAPLAQPQAVDLLKREADAVEILSTPSNFGSVSQFYQSFDPISDEKVIQVLKKRNMV